jgi:hypothetical protein
MRNTGWLRIGLGSLTLIAGSLGGFLVACGDDDNASTPKDGGADTSTPTEDSGGGDSGGNDSGPKDAGPPNAKLQLVNAATSFGPDNEVGAIRVCYGLAPTVLAPLPPLPDTAAAGQPFPGVFIGTGGAVDGTGADLSTIAITPYLINAQTLGERGIIKGNAANACAGLIFQDAGGALEEGKDFWKLPAIPANTFLKNKSYILILTGCAGNATVTPAAKCGADFTATPDTPGNGNLKVTVHEVDRATAIDADKIGAQFIHASAAGNAVITNGPPALGFVPAFMKAADAGAGSPLVTAPVAVNAKTDLTQVANVNVATDLFTINVNANPETLPIAIPLPLIQQATFGGPPPDGGAYRNGAAFTFIAVGDPQEPAQVGGNFNTKTFHYIAFPNDPINNVYKP